MFDGNPIGRTHRTIVIHNNVVFFLFCESQWMDMILKSSPKVCFRQTQASDM